tara:strand:+ start:35 stop:514 length:480 start_codon:yes stop_codon:yes gene_type:complete
MATQSIKGKQIADDTITGADVDESTLVLNVPSFLVYGKNSALTDQTSYFQLTTTNGSQNGQGWRMPVGGTVTHLSIQFDCTSYGGNQITLQTQLYKNGVGTNKMLDTIVDGTGNFGAHLSITPEAFNAGDRLTLYVQHSGTGITTTEVAATIRALTVTQ